MKRASECALSDRKDEDGVFFFFGSSSERYGADSQRLTEKNTGQLHYTAALKFILTELRGRGVILQGAADRSRHTTDRREAHAYFMTLRYIFLPNQRKGWCSNATCDLSYSTMVELDFPRATDIVPLCAVQ